jgi:sugar phosphate isomerase/epimerase
VHPRLSVSAVSSRQWSLDEDLRFWADVRIDRVGLSYRKLEEAGLARAADRVRDAGVRVSNIVELGWCDLHDDSTWPAHRERLLRAIGVASELGGCLVVTTGPAWRLSWDDAAGAFDEMLSPVRTEAERAEVPITLENTGSLRLDLSFVTTLRDAVDLARTTGTGVCMEVSSCYAERDLAGTVSRAGGLIRHVQVSDVVVGSLSTPDRAVPGDGGIPLRRIVGGLLDAGYTGAIELELVGPRIEEEGYASAISRAIAYLDDLLRELVPDQPRA